MGLLGAKGQTRKSYIFECCFIKEKKLNIQLSIFFHFVLRFIIFFMDFFFNHFLWNFFKKKQQKRENVCFFSIDGFREIVKSFWFRNIKKKLFPGQFFFFFKFRKVFNYNFGCEGNIFFFLKFGEIMFNQNFKNFVFEQ